MYTEKVRKRESLIDRGGNIDDVPIEVIGVVILYNTIHEHLGARMTARVLP